MDFLLFRCCYIHYAFRGQIYPPVVFHWIDRGNPILTLNTTLPNPRINFNYDTKSNPDSKPNTIFKLHRNNNPRFQSGRLRWLFYWNAFRNARSTTDSDITFTKHSRTTKGEIRLDMYAKHYFAQTMRILPRIVLKLGVFKYVFLSTY